MSEGGFPEDQIMADKAFVAALEVRVRHVRDNIKFKKRDKKKFLKGKLFHNDAIAVEDVMIAVSDTTQAYHSDTIVKANKNDVVLVSAKAAGLIFQEKLVESGHYDPLITSVLERLATVDKNHESDPDLQ